MTENVETPVQEVSIPQAVEEVQAQPTENVEEINWRKFRQQREEERKQREAAEKYALEKERETLALKKAMEALVSKPNYPQQNEMQELSDDEKIDRKVHEALRLREIQLEKSRIEKERVEFPQKLQSNFKDFDSVCTTENLDYLEYHYPEVATPYKRMEDGYEKWEGIYHALKRFIPNKNSIKDSKKADNNLSKPQSMARPGMTQTGDQAPVFMDEQRRASNWARMQKVIKGM